MSPPQSSSPSYPPAVDEAEREQLVQVIKDWAIANGLTVRPPPAEVAATEASLASTLGMPVPVTVFPSPFSKSCFDEAQSAQKAYNELYSAISQDEEFLTFILKELAGGDEFTANLWDIHLRVKKEGYVHKHALGIFRSDYLVHRDESEGQLQIKQVEFNTISASFGGLSSQTGKLHKFLAQTQYPLLKSAASFDLPDNNSGHDIAAGIRAAYDIYVESEPATLGHKRCVLFLTQEGERNVFDQRHVEYALVSGAGPAAGRGGGAPPPVFRLPFSQVLQHTSIADTPRRQLLYRLPSNPSTVYEVAVAYLRCGYDPSDYPDAAAWEARYQVERSSAIKCPTILTQVAGTKKVQQVLATPVVAGAAAPSELGRFLPEGSAPAQQIRRTFTNIYPLDTSAAGLQARAWAQDAAASRRFVLKPQREGGGHNYYKDKIPAHLKTVPEEHWASYILMELITPPPVANLILRNGQIEQGGVICELGIYGTCVWDSTSKGGDQASILHNATAGYLLRTKGDQSEEGGVAAGFGCMDSINLV